MAGKNNQSLHERIEVIEVIGVINEELYEEGLSIDEVSSFRACCVEYLKAFIFLRKYDEGIETEQDGSENKEIEKPDVEKLYLIIEAFKTYLASCGENVANFGVPNNGYLEQVVHNLYQTWNKEELYPGLEIKAAHLFYLLIKDHIFVDGNKRIASFLFLWFIDNHDMLAMSKDERTIPYNIIYALAIYVAESNPKDKDTIVQLICNIIASYSTLLPSDIPTEMSKEQEE